MLQPRLGIFLPTFEGSEPSGPGWSRNGVFRDTLRWPEMLAHARLIEESGFDSLWVPDHLLFGWDGERGPSQGAWDGWSILAALAAATARVIRTRAGARARAAGAARRRSAPCWPRR